MTTEPLDGTQYRLVAVDRLNWAVEKGTMATDGKNKGKLIWNRQGFYPKAEQAVEALLETRINENYRVAGLALIEAIHQAKKETLAAIKEVVYASKGDV